EHVPPDTVGNRQRVVVSDLAGRANIKYVLKQMGLDVVDDSMRQDLLARIKRMEHEGYDLETAVGTFELLVRSLLSMEVRLFDVEGYEVTTRKSRDDQLDTTATVTLRAPDEAHSATVRGGSALQVLHQCLQTCLAKRYPQIKELRLTDYKVRLLDSRDGVGGKVRVLVEWSDYAGRWSTMGVSGNVIEASWIALL